MLKAIFYYIQCQKYKFREFFLRSITAERLNCWAVQVFNNEHHIFWERQLINYIYGDIICPIFHVDLRLYKVTDMNLQGFRYVNHCLLHWHLRHAVFRFCLHTQKVTKKIKYQSMIQMLDPTTVSIAFLRMIWTYSKLVSSSLLDPNSISGVRILNGKMQKFNWQDYRSFNRCLWSLSLLYWTILLQELKRK